MQTEKQGEGTCIPFDTQYGKGSSKKEEVYGYPGFIQLCITIIHVADLEFRCHYSMIRIGCSL